MRTDRNRSERALIEASLASERTRVALSRCCKRAVSRVRLSAQGSGLANANDRSNCVR
jgi:hypothetical protein